MYWESRLSGVRRFGLVFVKLEGGFGLERFLGFFLVLIDCKKDIVYVFWKFLI